MEKKILITGAAGFIGFHVASALNKRGDQVIGLDNFNDYYNPLLKEKRAHLLQNEGIEVIRGDIANDSFLLEFYKKHQFTHIIHLAAQAGVRYALQNPKAYLTSNLEGFLNILELCRFNPECSLVYASSSSVYGCNDKIPFDIHDRTDQPANLYAATKKSNELMAFSYHHLFGIASVGLRYFTVYGPWGRPDMAYYNFSEAILSKKPISLYNRGNMRRDFTYIDDVVQGTIASLDLVNDQPRVFNIGNHRPVPLLDFVGLLEEKLGQKAIIELKGDTPGEVMETYADITESEKWLGYSPKTPLEKGLDHFIDWFKECRI